MDSPEVEGQRRRGRRSSPRSYACAFNAPSIVVDGPSGTKVLEDSPSKDDVEAAIAEVSGS